MTVALIVAGLAGAGLLSLSAWERAGRSANARAWLTSTGTMPVHAALFVRPGLGAILMGGALVMLFENLDPVAIPMAFFATLGLIMFFWGLLQLPYPRWWVPAYARGKVAQWKREKRG